MKQPRLIVSGISGGSGKTLISLGLTRLFTRAGLPVQPFKKGPDYIDYAWLAMAARRPSACLDPYFLEDSALLQHFCRVSRRRPAALSLMEGNRGLFDGRDLYGTCSTAHVARLLEAPVLLAMNCAKMTRTAAALVKGLCSFEKGLRLCVLLNNVASERHAALLRQAIEEYTDVPVLGILPRLRENPLPERHMGLALGKSDSSVEGRLDRLADLLAEHTDTDAILELARSAPDLHDRPEEPSLPPPAGKKPRIGYVLDDALWFYYEENLEALRNAGAELVALSILDPKPWPSLDALYLGGGYPELFAEVISRSPHLETIRRLSLESRPIYAECGGFMILCRALLLENGAYPMAGLFPLTTRFFPRPQGLGYVTARTLIATPFHPAGSVWKGHEFHYCRCEGTNAVPNFCLELQPGTGMCAREGRHFDGLLTRRTFACWSHLFAPAVPHWAQNFVNAARS